MVRAPESAPFVVSGIALCPRCRRDILPQRAVNSLHRDMWRAPSHGMVKLEKPDPKAQRIKARKDRKRSLRSITKEIGIVGAVTLVLRSRGTPNPLGSESTPASDDCPDCLARQRSATRSALPAPTHAPPITLVERTIPATQRPRSIRVPLDAEMQSDEGELYLGEDAA